MAIYHLGLIHPHVAVCECFWCFLFLFPLSYDLQLIFLFPFLFVQLWFTLKIKSMCNFTRPQQILVMRNFTLMLSPKVVTW
jgi:hypothetical protein